MFRSVKNWLTLLILGLVALAMLVAWTYVVPPLRDRLVTQKLADAKGNAQLISDTVIPWLSYDATTNRLLVTSDYGELDLTLRTIANRLGGRVILYTRNLVARKDSGGQSKVDVTDYPMLERSVRTGKVEQGVVQGRGQRYAATAVPLVPKGGSTVVAEVLVTSSLNDVDKAVDAVKRQLLLAAGLALAVSFLLGYLASYFIARRLKRIEQSAEAIAGGDLTAKVPDSVEDEIGQLARTFNTMGARLGEAFAQVEYQRDRIEVLLNDLSEGVVGIAADGTVSIANPAAEELLGRRLAEGTSLDEVVPEDLAGAWRESRSEGDEHLVVFVHDDRTLEAATYPVGGDADFTSIVVLRDVSAQARLERARRDLVANASHEFKTPLFSLAGFLELIDEGNLSEEERREFIQLSRVQVDRLRNLAVSMLDLSQVEAGSLELQPEDVDLELVAREVLDEFQAQAQAKDLKLVAEPAGGLTAWCDEQRLAQVLRALVDNAAKFSPAGSTIRVSVEREDKTARIAVTDDGPGIPEADLAHVFERFHRGREERASTAGAGLGLSIARELTELMGGSICAERPAGGGASFVIRLPAQAAPARGAIHNA